MDETNQHPAESQPPVLPSSDADASGDASSELYAQVVEATVVEAAVVEQRPQPHFGWAALATLFMLSVQLVTGVAVAILAVLAMAARGGDPGEAEDLLRDLTPVMVPVNTLASFLAAVAIVVVVHRSRWTRRIGLRTVRPLQMLLVLLYVVPLALVAGEVGSWADRFLPSLTDDVFMDLKRLPWPMVFAGVCVLPGLGEEIFFRGFLSRGLVAHHGLLAGSLLASMLFALSHIDPVQVCGTFVLGLGMQFVFLATRSLWASITVHILNNTLAMALMRLEPGVASESEIPWTVFAAALLALLTLSLALYQTRTRWQTSSGRPWQPGYFATDQPDSPHDVQPHTVRPGAAILLATLAANALLIVAILSVDW